MTTRRRGLARRHLAKQLGGNLVASMIDRFWWLAYVGSAVIVWTGTEMMFADPFLEDQLGMHGIAATVVTAVITVAVLAAAHYIHRHVPARRRLDEQPSSD